MESKWFFPEYYHFVDASYKNTFKVRKSVASEKKINLVFINKQKTVKKQ